MASSAGAQENGDAEAARTTVLALERAWNLAEAHKDARAMEQLMANTLIYVDYDGTVMTKAQALAEVKKAPVEQPKIVTESMAAQVYGKTVVVSGVYRDAGTVHGKVYSHKGRFLDVWVEENGAWQCVASQATLIGKGN